MKIKRIVAGAVTAGLVGVTPLAVSAPANATENHTVAITAAPSSTGVVYGSDIYVNVTAQATDGRFYPDGTTTLYVMPAGSSTWAPVQTVEAGMSFYDVKPRANSVYKVLYSGWAAQNTWENNYAPSESAAFRVAVQRDLTIKNPRGTLIKGKVAPKYKKKKIVIKRKYGKKWKKFRVLRTNKKSRFSIKLPAPRRGKWHWQIIVPGNRQFVASVSRGSTYSYRTVAPRVTIGR